MALLTSLVALTIDAMLPALSTIAKDLAVVDASQAHLVVSLFFLGLALGQIFYGPYADAKGRRAAILFGLIVFAIGTLVCMFAWSLQMLLVGRLIQAFGVSGPRVAALAVIRDKYQGEAMARVMSFIMMVFILVPMLAPLVGQLILEFASWRHIFTLFLFVALISAGWFFSRQTETLPKHRRQVFSWANLYRSVTFVLSHRKVMGYTMAMGFVFGAFLAYLSASQTIFQSIYPGGDLFPFIFALLAFSIGLASYFNSKMVMRLGMRKLCRKALLGLLLFSALLCLLDFYFHGLPPMWGFISVLFLAFFCVGILFGNLNAMAMQPLGNMAGLGAAIIGSLSSLFSVPIAIFIDSFIDHSISPIAQGFFVFTLLAIIAFHFANLPSDNKT